MNRYLVTDDRYGRFTAHLLTLKEIAAYVNEHYPVGTTVSTRVYLLNPNRDPERLVLGRTILKNGFIRSVYLEDRWRNLCDSITFEIPAEDDENDDSQRV